MKINLSPVQVSEIKFNKVIHDVVTTQNEEPAPIPKAYFRKHLKRANGLEEEQTLSEAEATNAQTPAHTNSVAHAAVASDNASVLYAKASTGAASDADEPLTQASPSSINSANLVVVPALTPIVGLGLGLGAVAIAANSGNSQKSTLSVIPDTTAPVFSSSTTTTMAENTAAGSVVHQAVATDNVAVSAYAFASSGADNDKFTLDATTGELKFKVSPDFETPTSAAGNNAYSVKVQANDAAGNTTEQTVTINVTDVDDTTPVFTSAATATVAENTAAGSVVHQAVATDNVAVSAYAFASSGADNDKFTLDATTGELKFKVSPNFEAPDSAAGSNAYSVKVQATDAAGNTTVQAVTISVNDVNETSQAPNSSAQAFTLWQEAETAWTELQTSSTTTHDIQALNTHSMAIMQQHDATSRDGSANQADAGKRLTQWVDQVTGTDVVSQAEYHSGFSITGHAAAGSSGTIKFYLDNDRTDGTNQVGTQLQDGVNGVHIAYNNISGDYTLSFDANSIMLKPATHSTWGSGIHQLSVDTDGNGAMNGAEASRLFLVADGTAHSSDTGTVAQNYSVQDKITGDAFVYYFGDPDGAGIGLSTPLDNGDTNANTGLVMTDKDTTVGGVYGDYDYYTSNVGSTVPAATAVNTALHLVTNIAAQTWEFHMATQTTTGSQIETTWDQNNTLAIDHVLFDSNTSRVASFQEAVALYAANFGGDNGGENTPGSTVAGAVQPIGNETWVNDRTPTAAEDNHPRSWDHDIWTAATLPGGHAVLDLYYANAVVFPDDFTQHGITVVM